MQTRHRTILAAALGLALAAAGLVARAQDATLKLVSLSSRDDGADRVFTIEIRNDAPDDALVQGRLVAISVYEASPATVMGLENTVIKAGETASLEVRWQGAPFVGRVRTLLVASDGRNPSLVSSSDFWILPVRPAAIFGITLLVLAILVVALMRLPVYLKKRVPENMISYRVDFGDTVVSISNRYGVTWQDIVKANRLKPPYEIKPGARIFIPRHGLQKPKAPEAPR